MTDRLTAELAAEQALDADKVVRPSHQADADEEDHDRDKGDAKGSTDVILEQENQADDSSADNGYDRDDEANDPAKDRNVLDEA